MTFDGYRLSDTAQRLHTFGILDGFRTGQPGWVDDRYLGTLRVDTSTATVELELAGLWSRGTGGYRVDEDELLRVVTIIDRQLRTASEALEPGQDG